jgi:hypothetical protein
MQIKIDSFSDLKQTDRGPSAKIKAGNDSYYVNEDPTNLVGKTVEIEVVEKTSAKGNKYKIATIKKVIDAAAGNGNGKITWDDYRAMAEAAHGLAAKLEPDGWKSASDLGEATLIVDRSTARAAILNTVMIAYSKGDIFVPVDDDMPF